MTLVHDLFRYRSLIWNFAERELKTRFKGSILGWVWSLAVPLATLGVYALVFGIVFRAQAPQFGNGRESVFAVWLFVGLVAFSFFSSGVQRGMAGLIAAGDLMRKVRLAPYTPVIGAVLAVGMQSLVEAALMLGVLALFANVSWTWLLLPLWIVLFAIFVTSLAFMCAVAAVHLRDMMQLIAIVLQFLFFITPIMYPVSLIPETYLGFPLREVLVQSPLARFVEMFRQLSYELVPGTLHQWFVLTAAAAVSLGLALLVLRFFGRDLPEQI